MTQVSVAITFAGFKKIHACLPFQSFRKHCCTFPSHLLLHSSAMPEFCSLASDDLLTGINRNKLGGFPARVDTFL
jgi:hypothetical protein